MSRLIVCMIAVVLGTSAVAQQGPTDCRERPAALSISTAASALCDADAPTCEAWRKFRARHPYPYQTIAIAPHADGNALTLIVSEPPPLGTAQAYANLFRATLQVDDASMKRLRFPTGLDGWLEDWVITVPLDKSSAVVDVAAADGSTVALAPSLANRIEFLSRTMFGTRSGFYVESLASSNAIASDAKPLPDLRLTTKSLASLASARASTWRSVTDPSGEPRAFSELATARSPGAFIDMQTGVVALAVPPKTNVRDLRGDFRQFAVASDYLVGAIEPKRGGVVLLARSRTEPLDRLPPLRFETLESLANNLGEPLGQSYERQRIFAGKMTSGTHKNWDWAPIYLSSQLQDTEFGTLLNIADQQLKSWSECSRVRYATFDYPDPADFPFEDLPASAWVMRNTGSPSLIFNWNTNGFSVATATPQGRIVTAAGTAALPVSYIVPNDPQTKSMQRLLKAIGVMPDTPAGGVDPAITASNKGSDYFAQRGDPILARVVQNVMLYQMMSDAKPFRVEAKVATARTNRSDVVTKLLVAEATPWLQQTLESGAAIALGSGTGSASADVRQAMQKTGLTTADLAELIAAPQGHGQRMLKLRNDIDVKRASVDRAIDTYDAAVDELRELNVKGEQDFRKRCADRSGSITETKTNDGISLHCAYTTTKLEVNDKDEGPYDARIAALERQLTSLKKELETSYQDTLGRVAQLRKMQDQADLADAMGDTLRQRASYTADLDAVLEKVLQATARTESQGSIQTPSVVLSRNVDSKTSVGGHNIDAMPWSMQQGVTKASPGLRLTGDIPTLVASKEKIGEGAGLARKLVRQENLEAAAVPEQTLAEALQMPQPPTGSFLDAIAQKQKLPSVDEALLAKFRSCECDVYVENVKDNTIGLVEKGPPPAARMLFGDAALIDVLSSRASGKKVLFENFDPARARVVGESALRRTQLRGEAGTAGDPLARSIALAQRLFARVQEAAMPMLQWRTRAGHDVAVFLDSGASKIAGAEYLATKPAWREAVVTVGGNAQEQVARPMIEIRFPNVSGDQLAGIEVFVRGAENAAARLNATLLANATKSELVRLARDKVLVRDAVAQVTDRMFSTTKDVHDVEIHLKSAGVLIVHLQRQGDTWVAMESHGRD